MGNSTPYNLYIDALRKWLWIEDEEGIRIIIGTAVAAMMPGDPLWLFVIDPPGALKTEICRSLTGPRVYSVDSLTPQSLITGFRSKKGENIDILPDLDGKVLIIKDFTTILSKPEKIRDDLLSKLRAAYDGELEQAYGSGVKKKGYKSTFGLIAAVTPVIEIYYKIHSILGERFVSVRPRYNRVEAVRCALEHSGMEQKMRKGISEVASDMLSFYELESKTTKPNLVRKDISKIQALGDVISILRSPVARDFQRDLLYIPEAEVGTRLAKQFYRLGHSLEVMGNYDYTAIKRCALDCLSPSRARIIFTLLNEGELTTTEITKKTRLTKNMVLTEGENLWLLGVLDRKEKAKSFHFSIKIDFIYKMVEAELE